VIEAPLRGTPDAAEARSLVPDGATTAGVEVEQDVGQLVLGREKE